MSKKIKIFPKISGFVDKVDSWVLGKESTSILAARDVNEIKEVVNEISQKLEEAVTFSELYSELRLKLPGSIVQRKFI